MRVFDLNKKSQIPSAKFQININGENIKIQICFENLIIDIWNLFVICFFDACYFT